MVSAPFEGDGGAIYIYFGSSDGILQKPAQKIYAPHNEFTLNQMFGYGLSKGVDIDVNKYVDFAIGAPGGNTVYIYKTYPVIEISTTIEPIDSKIQINATSFKLMTCFSYNSKHTITFDIQLSVIVKLDDKFNRAYFQNAECNGKECKFDVTLPPEVDPKSNPVQCITLEASITFLTNYIYEPIKLGMTHIVTNSIPKYDAIIDEAQGICFFFFFAYYHCSYTNNYFRILRNLCCG